MPISAGDQEALIAVLETGALPDGHATEVGATG
jgi:hypothetical protein